MQQADVVQESLNYKIELDDLKKALNEKKKEQEREQLQLKASIDMAKRELAGISVRFYYQKKAKKMDQTQQQYLVRESWKCKYSIDALKKELSDKKKETQK